MAIVESIPEKKQTPSAQKGVLDYCMKPSKTFDEDEQLAYISGYNCIPELANEAFLATQKIFGHEPDGIRFYHFVQSFKIGESITPQEANDIGMELAKSFGNREAIVATHIDCGHLHNHIVVCAYDLESGLKLHYNKYYLADLRTKSDEICRAHGLDVLKKYDPNIKSPRLGPKEYRAAERGNSWKMALRATIDYCMTRAKTKAEFENEMRKYGYVMVWTPTRKYITYICHTEDGKEYRVRDIKLNDEKYLKENMENEFKIRTELYGQAQSEEFASGTERSDAGGSTETASRTNDSYGSDQRRGVETTDRNNTENGSAVGGNIGTQSRFEGIGGGLRRDDDKGGTGANRGFGESDTENSNRSERTSWEIERESFRRYQKTDHSGRSNLVASTRTHSNPGDIGLALMGARGLGNLTSLFEDGEESEEEKRQREARNAGSALGAVAGLATGIALGLADEQADSDEDIDDDEDEGFDITM